MPVSSTTEAAYAAGVSFRQTDYWVRQGLIPGVIHSEGIGHPREFTNEQVKFLSMMGALVKAGMKPDKASEMVTDLLAGKIVRLGTWIKVEKI